jgi:hypothetical protein
MTTSASWVESKPSDDEKLALSAKTDSILNEKATLTVMWIVSAHGSIINASGARHVLWAGGGGMRV